MGAFLTYIKGLRPKERLAGAYGSCGWAGGGVKQVDAELRSLGLEVMDPLEVRYMPSAEDLEACVELGRQVARQVKGEKGEAVTVTVLGLAGSARRGGNTETLLDWCLAGARDEGAVVIKVALSDLDLHGCRACDACRETGVCIQKDDMELLYPHLRSGGLDRHRCSHLLSGYARCPQDGHRQVPAAVGAQVCAEAAHRRPG